MRTVAQSMIRAAWVAAAVLALPALAMAFPSEMAWGPADFLVAGLLVFAATLVCDRLSNRNSHRAYRAGVVLAVGTSLALIWAALAVGIVNAEDDLANLRYFGVVGVGVAGSLLGQFKPRRMAGAWWAAAAAQVAAGILAFGQPVAVLAAHVAFAGLFATSGLLFWRAAQAP